MIFVGFALASIIDTIIPMSYAFVTYILPIFATV
jgi:hypothetical protein